MEREMRSDSFLFVRLPGRSFARSPGRSPGRPVVRVESEGDDGGARGVVASESASERDGGD